MTIHVAMNIAAKDKMYNGSPQGSKDLVEFSPFMTCCKAKVAKSFIRCLGRVTRQSAILRRPPK